MKINTTFPYQRGCGHLGLADASAPSEYGDRTLRPASPGPNWRHAFGIVLWEWPVCAQNLLKPASISSDSIRRIGRATFLFRVDFEAAQLLQLIRGE